MVPYLAIGFVSVLLVIVEARLVFGVPLRGSMLLLLGEGLLFILFSLSLGMLISSRTSSQRVAMMGALIGTMLPTMLLSGHLSHREHAEDPAVCLVCDPGPLVRGNREEHHAQGRGARFPLAAEPGGQGMALVLLVMSTRSSTFAWNSHATRFCPGSGRHVIRDKATLAQVIIMPVVQLIVLANAATFTIRDTPAYVVDLDRSPTSRGLVNRITGSGHFFIAGSPSRPTRPNNVLLAGDATLVVTIPADFENSW